MKKTKVAIIGASGYSGQDLIRLLLRHPQVEITSFSSRQYAGRPVAEVFPRFRGQIDTLFNAPSTEAIGSGRSPEVVFLALPHGVAVQYAPILLQQGRKVLDLSSDFRLRSAETYREFYGQEHTEPQLLERAVYGLPELHREQIRAADLVACPGCYPTRILLAIAPELKEGLIKPNGIVATSLSGVSGAGRKVTEEYLFTECNESARDYGLPEHRHIGEIEQELNLMAGDAEAGRIKVSFAPHLIPLNRGILSTIFMDIVTAAPRSEEVLAIYREFYRGEPFVRVSEALPNTKNVEMTNYLDVAVRVDARTNKLIAISALDNLTKGAAGQAIQCLNLVSGYEEPLGLRDL